MHSEDIQFFEEYKHLEKLCSEIYLCNNGVSEYISQMENYAVQAQYRIPSWKSDYNMLKHVRWVRNQIAHGDVTYQASTPDDLNFVREFHSRIFSGQDPLTLLRKANEQKNAQSRPKAVSSRPASYTPVSSRSYTPISSTSYSPPRPMKADRYPSPKKESHKFPTVLIVLILLLLVFWFLSTCFQNPG